MILTNLTCKMITVRGDRMSRTSHAIHIPLMHHWDKTTHVRAVHMRCSWCFSLPFRVFVARFVACTFLEKSCWGGSQNSQNLMTILFDTSSITELIQKKYIFKQMSESGTGTLQNTRTFLERNTSLRRSITDNAEGNRGGWTFNLPPQCSLSLSASLYLTLLLLWELAADCWGRQLNESMLVFKSVNTCHTHTHTHNTHTLSDVDLDVSQTERKGYWSCFISLLLR